MRNGDSRSVYYKVIAVFLAVIVATLGLSIRKAEAGALVDFFVCTVGEALGLNSCGGGSYSSGHPPPPPTVSLAGSSSAVDKGQTVTLTWSSTNATVCTLAPDFGQVDLSGSGDTQPIEQDTTYTFECSGASGDVSTTAMIQALPVAGMDVSKDAVSLTSENPGSPVTITNTGDPGSVLNWAASASDYTENVEGWLTFSKNPGSEANPTSGGNASDPVTLSANTAMLIAGNYQTTVTFAGTSAPGGADKHFGKSVTVDLRIGAGCPPSNPHCGGYAPVCSDFSANPTHVVVPLTSTLSYNCNHVSSCAITGSDGLSYTVPMTTAESAQGSHTVGPKGTTSYTLSCMGVGNAIHISTSLKIDIEAKTPGVKEVPPL